MTDHAASAALPIRRGKAGRTSWRTEKVEAQENAGESSIIPKRTIGSCRDDDAPEDATDLRCEVTAVAMEVNKLRRRCKERDTCKRRWFAPKKAAKMREEKELSKLLMDWADKPQRRAALE